MKKSSVAQLIICLSAAVILTGCTTLKSEPSGFLQDYSNFQESEEVKGRFVEENPFRNISEYSKFLIAPIQIHFQADSKGVSVKPDKLKELTDYFQAELTAALEEKYEVVQEPGVDVLLIRAAVTDIVANKIYLNLHWSTTLTGAGIGGATIEAEFVDSMTGERILAVIDARKGKQYRYTKGLTKWGHTKDMLKKWSQALADDLDSKYQDGKSKFAVVEASEVEIEEE